MKKIINIFFGITLLSGSFLFCMQDSYYGSFNRHCLSALPDLSIVQKVPNEILGQIFEFLCFKDLQNFKRLNKKFCKLVEIYFENSPDYSSRTLKILLSRKNIFIDKNDFIKMIDFLEKKIIKFIKNKKRKLFISSKYGLEQVCSKEEMIKLIDRLFEYRESEIACKRKKCHKSLYIGLFVCVSIMMVVTLFEITILSLEASCDKNKDLYCDFFCKIFGENSGFC